jgi:hypothetical protein
MGLNLREKVNRLLYQNADVGGLGTYHPAPDRLHQQPMLAGLGSDQVANDRFGGLPLG